MFTGAQAKTFSAQRIVGYGPQNGQPRNEISDAACRINFTEADHDALVPYDDSKGKLVLPSRHMRLEEFLKHDELYSAYPGLRRARLSLGWPMGCVDGTSYTSAFTLNGNFTLIPWSLNTPDDIRRSLLHELQHEVQEIEGFTGGSNYYQQLGSAFSTLAARLERRQLRTPSDELALKQIQLVLAYKARQSIFYGDALMCLPGVQEADTQLTRRAGRLYEKVPGEIEANTTAARGHMTEQERLAQPAPHLLAAPPTYPMAPDDSNTRSAQRRNQRREMMVNASSAFNRLLVRAGLRPATAPTHIP